MIRMLKGELFFIRSDAGRKVPIQGSLDLVLDEAYETFKEAEVVLKSPRTEQQDVLHTCGDMALIIKELYCAHEFGWAMGYVGRYEGLIKKSPHFQ